MVLATAPLVSGYLLWVQRLIADMYLTLSAIHRESVTFFPTTHILTSSKGPLTIYWNLTFFILIFYSLLTVLMYKSCQIFVCNLLPSSGDIYLLIFGKAKFYTAFMFNLYSYSSVDYIQSRTVAHNSIIENSYP